MDPIEVDGGASAPNPSTVITNGAVSGALPESEAFAVNYPGYPSSTARAVDTLGGLDEIAKARSSDSNQLELRFRPEDPFCHPAFGERRAFAGLLLKISKTRSASDNGGKEQLSAEVVARVNEAYHFKGMVDYQHVLAVHAAEARRKKQHYVFDEDPDLGEEADVMMLVPPLFSLKNIPEEIVLNSPSNLFSRNLQKSVVEHRWEMDIEPCLAIAFDIENEERERRTIPGREPFPITVLINQGLALYAYLSALVQGDLTRHIQGEVPLHMLFADDNYLAFWQARLGNGISDPDLALLSENTVWNFTFMQLSNFRHGETFPEKVNWEENIPRGTTDWELQLAVSKLFEERPIWPKRAIYEELLDNGLEVSDHMLRRLLFRSGYYFSTGPFGRLWIRKGYDPRKDPDSGKFQRVDFRVPSQLRNVSDANTDAGYRSKQRWKDICRFQVFPWKNFTTLQFFELDDDFIRDEIQKPTDQTTCSSTRGWFSETLLRTLRLRVSVRFLSKCSAEGAEILLQSFCEEFERCKKLEALSRVRKPVVKHQHLNQDTDLSTGVCAESNGTEHQPLGHDGLNNCEIENDEEEDEEEEEELDAYESPAVAVEDGCFSAETSSYQVGDSVTNDYLQDILREFPFGKDRDDSRSNKEVQDADFSDGEYEIYEQDSDSDDEDDDEDFS